jgi:glycosyltransferase involved in cell wall biosynthesis
MLRDKPDALFVPVHTLPFFCPKKTVRAIHDVSFLRQPDAYSLRERTYMKFDLWRAKRICTSVIVPTEAVKHDLVNLLGWSAEKIIVTGWGVPEALVPPNPVPAPKNPFVLFVSRVEEKKNVANIIRAFGLFKETHPEWELILAGKPGHGFEAIEPFLKNPGVHHLGYISNEKKAELLATTSMLAFVSREEGFAFPMLEAFQAKVPVLASSIPTLTEIAEDAALFAEPNDVKKIAENMSLIADNSAVRTSLVAKGTEKLKKYSWESVTEKVLGALVE